MKRLVLILFVALAFPASAQAAQEAVTFEASDGAKLHAFVSDTSTPRPTIIEFSPYAPACCGNDFGPEYNHVVVHARGTGNSTGTWSAIGKRDQQDIAEFVAWACEQPWSNGHLGLYGFSASAIAVYNSLHQDLKCVDAAALMAGSDDLYRDLIYPGGITNVVPATVVGATIGGLFLGSAPNHAGDPIAGFETGVGLLTTFAEVLTHRQLDDFWLDRTRRDGPNRIPVLVDTGFYDVESRGPFESFRALRENDAHLIVLGAHDGHPAGTGGPFPHYQRWFDRYLRGEANGIAREPKVQAWLGNGSREALLAGEVTKRSGSRWPLPGTRWRRFFLGPDKTLEREAPEKQATHSYAAVPSPGTATDPHTTGVTGAGFGFVTQMDTVDQQALKYTTPAFEEAVDVAGPASLLVHLSSTAPETDILAVVADVWPDGRAFPVGAGRLRTAYPEIDRKRSIIRGGEVVQPYGVYSKTKPAAVGESRRYHVEFWPLGNRFEKGHKLRLYLVGTSSFMEPALPGVNTVALGGKTRSRLLVPVLP